MAESINSLLAPRYLFQFSMPLKRQEPIWSKVGVVLDESYRLPNLAQLDRETPSSEPNFADVRAAWGPQGLAFTVEVIGKKQPLWCRESRLDESDGLQVWIDTRATHTIHRASKFCSRFVFLPAGAGRGDASPVADQLLIQRARENARPVRPRELQVLSKVTESGYRLSAFVPGMVMTGYDPQQHQRIGFQYAVIDRELGLQTFSNGATLPYDEDPSCWATLELAES